MPAKLRAIFFDVDETLFATSEFTERARLAAIKGMQEVGLSMSLETCYRELQEVIVEFGSNYGSHYDKLLKRISPSYWQGINPSILVAAAVTAYHGCKRDTLAPYPDVLEVLGELRNSGLILGIITHGLEVKQAEKLLRLGIYPYLCPEAIFITEQMGISKPNPKLYRRACSAMDVMPGEAIYVGDHPVNDVDAANAAGLLTVRLRRGGRFLHQEGQTKADFELTDFHELPGIVRQVQESTIE
jgi:putative hydrolase of the HAD superfamily